MFCLRRFTHYTVYRTQFHLLCADNWSSCQSYEFNKWRIARSPPSPCCLKRNWASKVFSDVEVSKHANHSLAETGSHSLELNEETQPKREPMITIHTTEGEQTLKVKELYQNIKYMHSKNVLHMVSTSGESLDQTHLAICLKRLFVVQHRFVEEKLKNQFIQSVRQDPQFEVLCALIAQKAKYYDADLALDMFHFMIAFGLDTSHPAVQVYLHIIKHQVNEMHIDQLVKVVKMLKRLRPDLYPLQSFSSDHGDIFDLSHQEGIDPLKDDCTKQIHLINAGLIALINSQQRAVVRLRWDDAVFLLGSFSAALHQHTVFRLIKYVNSTSQDVEMFPKECHSIIEGICNYLRRKGANASDEKEMALKLGRICAKNLTGISDFEGFDAKECIAIAKNVTLFNVKSSWRIDLDLFLNRLGEHLCASNCNLQELTQAARQFQKGYFVNKHLLEHTLFKVVDHIESSDFKEFKPQKWMMDFINCMAELKDSDSVSLYINRLCCEEMLDKVMDYCESAGEPKMLRSLLSIIRLSKSSSAGAHGLPDSVHTAVKALLENRVYGSFENDEKFNDGITNGERMQVLLQYFPLKDGQERLRQKLSEFVTQHKKEQRNLQSTIEAIVGHTTLHSVCTPQGFHIDHLVCRKDGLFEEFITEPVLDATFWSDTTHLKLGVMLFRPSAFNINTRQLKAASQLYVDQVQKAGIIPIVVNSTYWFYQDQVEREAWLAYQLLNTQTTASNTYLGVAFTH